jgi:hypothetical protein
MQVDDLLVTRLNCLQLTSVFSAVVGQNYGVEYFGSPQRFNSTATRIQFLADGNVQGCIYYQHFRYPYYPTLQVK